MVKSVLARFKKRLEAVGLAVGFDAFFAGRQCAQAADTGRLPARLDAPPLHDAIGQSGRKLRNVLATTGAKDYQVLVTVLTDGEENASTEFTRPIIRQLIEQLKEQDWTFTYIGANHDVDRAANGLAIDNKLAFTQNEAEMDVMFAKERVARRSYNLKSKEDLYAGRSKADYFDDDEPAHPTPPADAPQT